MSALRRPLPALLLATAVACSDSTGPAARTPASLRAGAERVVVGIDDTTRLRATVYDADGRAILDSTVRWRSLDPLRASVVATSGLATGVDTGTARIVASLGALEDTVLLAITRRVASLTLSFARDSLFSGIAYGATAVALDARGQVIPDAPLLWTSSDSTIVKAAPGSAPGQGAVYGHQEGAATLRVSSGAASATKSVRTVLTRMGFGGPRPVHLSLGSSHGCALDAEGRAYCWGSNRSGSLGRGTTEPMTGATPVEVTGGHRFTALEARDASSCGLTTAGRLLCWGRNAGATSSGTPTGVLDSVTFTALAVGMHNQSCAIDAASLARCWGHNDTYQLGRGPLAGYDPAPLPVAGTQRFKGSVSLGGFGGCAVGTDDSTWCWGDMNNRAPGLPNDRPQRVEGAPAFVQLESFSNGATCGRTASGEVWCWGVNYGGYFAAATPDVSPTAIRIAGLPPAVGLDTGVDHACIITAEGEVWCWGGPNAFGHGYRDRVSAPPARFGGTRRFRTFATSYAGTCGLTDDGVALCAGAVPATGQ